MLIRPYRESDREALKEITAICFDGVSIDRNIEAVFGEVAGHDWRWRKLRHIDADIAAHAGGILVAEADGEPVGYITTRLDREAGVGTIPNLAVRPDRQKQGIGRKLIAAAIELCRTEGMELARIETLAQNEVGRHLYPQMGFEEVATQVHFAMRL